MNIWEQIKEELKVISKDIFNTTNAPATSEEIHMLEKALGIKLPQHFREYLSVLNGQKNTEESTRDRNKEVPMLGYNTFLSVQGIIETWNMMNEIFEDMKEPIQWRVEDKILPVVWNKGWIPFAEYEGNCLILDCSPGKNGTYGQVFLRPNVADEEEVLGESFEEFSSGILERLTKRTFEIGVFGIIDFTDNYLS